MGNNYLFKSVILKDITSEETEPAQINLIWLENIREQYLYTVIHVHVYMTGTGFN